MGMFPVDDQRFIGTGAEWYTKRLQDLFLGPVPLLRALGLAGEGGEIGR
jgi:hypothetical protein